MRQSRSAIVHTSDFWNGRMFCRRERAGACGHAPLRAAFPAAEANDNTTPMQIRNTQLGTDLRRRVTVWGIIPRTSDARPYTVIWWLVRIWLQQLPFIDWAATGKIEQQNKVPYCTSELGLDFFAFVDYHDTVILAQAISFLRLGGIYDVQTQTRDLVHQDLQHTCADPKPGSAAILPADSAAAGEIPAAGTKVDGFLAQLCEQGFLIATGEDDAS